MESQSSENTRVFWRSPRAYLEDSDKRDAEKSLIFEIFGQFQHKEYGDANKKMYRFYDCPAVHGF
jgi:hypothetical protein